MSILTRLITVDRTTAVRVITDEAVPRPSFYVLVLLSTALASYGLLANSIAVVIGAMLIAPLMGPIYGIALGLVRGDRRLPWMASLSEAGRILLAIVLAVVIGSLPLRPDFGSEILAREVLQRMLDQRSPDTELLAVRVAEGETTTVNATVLGPRSLSRRSVDQLNGELSETIGRPTRLIVRSVPSTRVGASRAAGTERPKAAR